MRTPIDSRNKLLLLLKEVADCTFVRVTEHRHKEILKHQFGELTEVAHKHSNQLEAMSASEVTFYQEASHNIENYQLNIAVYNDKHVHIECAEVKSLASTHEKISRRSTISHSKAPYRVEVSLYYAQQPPVFVQDLGIDSQERSNTSSSANKRSQVLLHTITVMLEGLQLIEHYEKLTSDSLTKLQSRTSLQREIDEQIYRSSIALCMIHCTDFQHVNRKFGQAKGDNVLHEIANIINEHTRIEDISGRFGGALFGIAIHANSIEDGYKLAVKLQDALHNKPYLKNAIRLSFNVGVAFVSQDEAQIDTNTTSSLLISRAEQALKAAQNSNTPSIVQWEPDKFRLDEQEFNYLGGIFTPDNVTNYRNMLLLWDISSIIADEPSFSKLLKSVIERLAYTFEFEYAGIISSSDISSSNYGYKLVNSTDIIEVDWQECDYNDALRNAAKVAVKNSQHGEHEEDSNKALIIPLGTDTQECFILLGKISLLNLTHDSVSLFVGFARQIGKALKRSQLEDELNKKLEEQNAVLAKELLDLKTGMQSSALVYRSAKMQKIVEQTQRAAQSDATVLITGESGTGKEKLIHAIHSLSPRSNKPLVIVDCGSMPETLIESELFGHTKGAFTGAQSDSKGKIQAANGGILVLDEIGELPLSMQPKLLRFVQEKHYTPVGSARSIEVDVKIVAVTNRDLAYEVSQGRFRKDLYYRLNVVSLHNPCLRERPEDIDLLCQHFLSKFALQFNADKKFLSVHTIDLMKRYSWPGNIRELENKLMQASLLTKNDEITFDDLQLDTNNPSDVPSINNSMSYANMPTRYELGAMEAFTSTVDLASASKNISSPNKADTNPTITQPHSAIFAPHNSDEVTHLQAASIQQWEAMFASQVDHLIEEITSQNKMHAVIGSNIEAQILNMAFEKCGSHSKTALLLQIPVSTARRRLMKTEPDLTALAESKHWHNIIELLQQVLQRQLYFDAPMELIKNIVATRILASYTQNMTLAASLMGVSEPTMYKLRKLL